MTNSTLSMQPSNSQAHIKSLLSVSESTQTLPALFISHGAPTLALEHSATTNALARIGQNLPKPKAIIIMSAHWLSPKLEINSNLKPTTWHDFTGFDSSLDQLRYPALGFPNLAHALLGLLDGANIKARLNPMRAFDHGVWIPLLHLYPDADIPVIQVSLPQHYDAIACYQLGATLAQLRQQQVLIIGSGNITHNLAAMRWNADSIDGSAKAFKRWLMTQLKQDILAALNWQSFADVDKVHPTHEHLLPLFFALGAGQRMSVIHESMAHHSLGMDIYRFD